MFSFSVNVKTYRHNYYLHTCMKYVHLQNYRNSISLVVLSKIKKKNHHNGFALTHSYI